MIILKHFCILFIFAFYLPSFAINISFGVKGGLNFSSWRGADDSEFDNQNVGDQIGPYEDRTVKLGPNIGLFLNLRLFKLFEIQPEIVYSSKGIRQEEENTLPVGPSKMVYVTSISYIEFPLLFKFVIPRSISENKRICIFAGPVYARLLNVSGYSRITNNGETDKQKMSSSIKKIMSGMLEENDFGISFGIMFKVGKGPGRFIFDLRCTPGFIQIYDTVEPLDGGVGAEVETYTIANAGSNNIPGHKNLNISGLIGFSYEL